MQSSTEAKNARSKRHSKNVATSGTRPLAVTPQLEFSHEIDLASGDEAQHGLSFYLVSLFSTLGAGSESSRRSHARRFRNFSIRIGSTNRDSAHPDRPPRISGSVPMD